MIEIAVLVSGGGSNLQSVIDAVESGKIENARISLVLSSNPSAYALERAKKHNIRSVITKDANRIKQELQGADLIVLAGYMSILPVDLVAEFEGRILNIHPSLIPKHCGKGYYGKRVHQSVLESGDTVSGATVHLVDEGVDTGEIIIQREVPVEVNDTVETLAARVLETEHDILVEAIQKVIKERNKWVVYLVYQVKTTA